MENLIRADIIYENQVYKVRFSYKNEDIKTHCVTLCNRGDVMDYLMGKEDIEKLIAFLQGAIGEKDD